MQCTGGIGARQCVAGFGEVIDADPLVAVLDEKIGGTRGLFPDDDSPANLAESMAVIPEQMARGFTTFCIKPNQLE